jgi:polyisoprenoid-binding protein YceI
MATDTQPLTGTFKVDPIHSSFGFAVTYMGVSTFRSTFEEVTADLSTTDTGLKLTGSAKVESINIRQPEAFRGHVLSADFFDAEQHPELQFESTSVALETDGRARVEGTLTIKDTAKPVVAEGTWAAPQTDAAGHERAHLYLEATVSRKDFGLQWDAPLPNGGTALGDDVTISVDASLIALEH